MKPHSSPEWPRDRSITPRVAGFGVLQQLGVVDLDLPVGQHLLCEVLPFGFVEDDDGVEWVAVRVTIDFPLTQMSVSTGGWVARSDLEQLPPLRELIREAPSDCSSLEVAIDSTDITDVPGTRPSERLVKSVKPSDGENLLAAWRDGRRPVLRTIAFLELALSSMPDVAQEIIQVAIFYLNARRFGREQRAKIVEALDFVTAVVGNWSDWKSPPTIGDLDLFPPGFFDDYDFGADDDHGDVD